MRCYKCKEEKPESSFAEDSSRKQRKKEYLCKDCKSERSRKHYLKNKQASRNNHLKRTYGITPEYYETLYGFQEGCCAICRKQFVRLSVDHSHTSGAIRALLCANCNRGLGMFRENIKTLETAISYLKAHSE